MTSEFFEIERHDDATATLWMNRPEVRNAMGPSFWNDLPVVMEQLGSDPDVRAIVLAARGKSFTAGLDLKSMTGSITGNGGRFSLQDEIRRLQGSITSVASCPKPVIAAIHGHCIGGGIDLVTACDVRYASKDAVFSIRETRIAIVADVGTLQRLPHIIGKGHVAELAYTGEDFDAEYAEKIHLVNRVFDDADATVAAARDLASRIAKNSPLAVEGTKRVLDFCEGKSVEDGLRYVATWNAAYVQSNDLREAMAAFMEKREPRFTGK